MSKIAPYFKICKFCYLHGNIIFPDGSSSEDIVLKEQGIAIIADAFKKGKILGFEASVLTNQIKKSHLLSEDIILKSIDKTIKIFEQAEEKIKEIGCQEFGGNILN